MARVRQFANDMGMSYNQAKNLVNKGRALKDGGSSVLENTMNKAKPIKAAKGKFPDLSGDGETTMKDILIGRGVIEKKEGGGIPEGRQMKAMMGSKMSSRREPETIMTPFKGTLKTSKGETLKNIDGKTFIVKPNPKFKKPQRKMKKGGTLNYREGGQFRGCGAQIKGKKFKGIF